MALSTTRATRKPFYVDAIRVTALNMQEVAEWCGGEIRKTAPKPQIGGELGQKNYIHVPVEHASNERQTKAYVGDWVLRANGTFKVYTNKAYVNGFDPVGDLVCGDTSLTLDHQPCVLNHKHMTARVAVGCRSFNDYVELERRHATPPVAELDSKMGPALSEACA